MIAAIFNGVPILNDWLTKFLDFYIGWQKERNKTAFRESLRNVIEKHDQRELEEGSVSGVPSDVGGVQDKDA